MTAIILTLGSAGVMCVAGVGVSSALRWFHAFELDTSKKDSPVEVEDTLAGTNAGRVRALGRRMR